MTIENLGELCQLCQEPLGDDAKAIIRFRFIGYGKLEFKMLDGTAAHRSCMNSWNKRHEFVTFWNKVAFKKFGKDVRPLQIDDTGVAYADEKV